VRRHWRCRRTRELLEAFQVAPRLAVIARRRQIAVPLQPDKSVIQITASNSESRLTRADRCSAWPQNQAITRGPAQARLPVPWYDSSRAARELRPVRKEADVTAEGVVLVV
jgi:hypothetical protein